MTRRLAKVLFRFVVIATVLQYASAASAQQEPERESPWLVVPLLSANPKLDTAAGAMVAYVHKFDEKSRASMLGLQAKYSTSDSVVAGLFGRSSWAEDHHRLNAGLAFGNINNDYQNYQETGQEVNTQDRLRAMFARYLYRFKGDFFFGVQGAYTNYELVGKSQADDEILDNLGLVGYKSGGVGLSLLYDTRDNDFKPMNGGYMNANNISYREALGGKSNFDIYRLDLRYFLAHGKGSVLAFRQRNQWSVNAPPGAYSPVYLRGYTPGEFLAQNMSSVEVEERLYIAERWTSTFFAGFALLYGDGSSALENTDFPSVGLGIQYILMPKQGMVANLEGAMGRDEDRGLYLKMGYAF